MASATEWLGDQEAKPAPGPLRRIQALINTIDRETGQDRLAHPDDAAPWLVDNELLAAGRTPTPADLAAVVGVREALRTLVVHNAGGPAPTAGQLVPLREIASGGSVRATLDDDGAGCFAGNALHRDGGEQHRRGHQQGELFYDVSHGSNPFLF